MKLSRSKTLYVPEIFLVPALNVILLLIFFLLISMPFMVQPGVTVNMPESPFMLMPQRDPQIISITAAPISAIYFENEEVDILSLKKKLEADRAHSHTLIIKADRFAPYDQVTKVLNIALELGFPTVLASAKG